MMGKGRDGLLPVEDAKAEILAGISLLESERINLAAAHGRVLAEDLASRITQPPKPVSAMDGYAVRSADVTHAPVTLRMIGESAAGTSFDGCIGPGETVRIFTGAAVPEGGDAIVIQEDTEVDGDQIILHEAATSGRYVRPRGLDFEKGQVLLKSGTTLNSRHVALAAGMNVPWINVRRQPRVAILSTGNELVLPGETIGEDQIISSNSIGMAAFVDAAGGTGINLGIARDNPQSLKSMLKGVAGADILVTIGGASVGDYDLVKSVLGEEGLDINFSRVAMRPGKPLIFGTIYGKPMLGLPGNPVSAGVTAALFLKPAIDVMLGRDVSAQDQETAILTRDLPENDRRQDYLRALLGRNEAGDLTVQPFEKQDSSMLAIFSNADCLAVRAPFAGPAKSGDRIRIIRLDPRG